MIALVGFAGPRVIQQTINQDLPEGFQRAEFLRQTWSSRSELVHRLENLRIIKICSLNFILRLPRFRYSFSLL